MTVPTLMAALLLILFFVPTVSSYIFEFTIQIEGPQSNCDTRDFRVILHGVEELLDENCNEFLKYAGYPGFVDRVNLFIDDGKEKVVGGRFVLGPFYGDAECESCPQDDKDSFFIRRAMFDRLSKKEISAYVNRELQDELSAIVQSRSLSECASMSDQWKATFRWL